MNDGTLLFRQVHPRFVRQDRVTSQAFMPSPQARNRLSVYDGDMITAEAAWLHYTGPLALRSAGAVAVTVAECSGADVEVRPDPDPFPEHAVLDFQGIGISRVRSVAKRLRALASERGWQYRAEEPT